MFCLGVFCLGGFCLGGFCPGGFCPGVHVREFLSRGFCPRTPLVGNIKGETKKLISCHGEQ